MPNDKSDKAEKFVQLGGISFNDILKRMIKYVVEGVAVAFAAFYIPKAKMKMQDVMMIALTAAATFAILDMVTPSIAEAARKGAGFGIGLKRVGAQL